MKAIPWGLGIFNLVCSLQAYSWNYELAPYLWASSLEGTQQTGSYRFHVSESFAELLKQLDFGAMLYAAAYHNNWGIFFNGIYSKVSDDIALDDLNIRTSSVMTINNAGLSYKITPAPQWTVEPYLGARYTLNDTNIAINLLNSKQKYNWTDAILGTRISYKVNPAFSIEGIADYGRGAHSSSYNLSALLGYQSPNHFKDTRFYLGYRFLHQNYHHGEDSTYYLWDINLLGPIAGFAYRF